MADAEIIAVGSELLTPNRIDTNSLWLTDQLNSLGVEVRRKVVVGDDRELLSAVIRQSLKQVDIVILSGGLGPTEDDVTREAVAEALGRPLVFRQDLARRAHRTFPAPESQNGRQQSAPDLRRRRRRAVAQRPRHRRRPVDRGRQQSGDAAARARRMN